MTPISSVSIIEHRLKQAIFIMSKQPVFAQIGIQTIKQRLHGNHAEQEKNVPLNALLADRHIHLQDQNHLVYAAKKRQ